MRKKISQLKRRTALAGRRHARTALRVAKKPLVVIPAITFLGLCVLVLSFILVATHGRPQLKPSDDTNIVIVNDNKHDRTVPTNAQTVGELLDRLDIRLHEGDVVEPDKATEIAGDNFRINVYRAVPVTIVDGEHKTFAYSAAATPRSIVKQAGITVYPEDRMALMPAENFITESSIGERVVIDRATPVNVNLYGTPVAMRTHATTVRALLKEKNINLGKGDTVEPALNMALSPATPVFLVRKGTKITTEEQPIAMPVQTIEDSSLTFGTTAVRQQGAPGKKLVTYQIELQNGQEIGRKVIQEIVAQDAVTQVVAKGTHFDIDKSKTAVMAAAGISTGSYSYADYVIEHESHWNPAALNSRGCAGLGQACPGSKLSASCPGWQTDPVCQMRFFNKYAVDRYKGWAAAYSHKVAYGWW